MKGEDTVDHCTVVRWLKKCHLGCKNLSDQVRSGQLKTIYSKNVLKDIEANLVSSTWRVSGGLDISQSDLVHHLYKFSKRHLELLNCASHYKNIAKILTYLRRHTLPTWKINTWYSFNHSDIIWLCVKLRKYQ